MKTTNPLNPETVFKDAVIWKTTKNGSGTAIYTTVLDPAEMLAYLRDYYSCWDGARDHDTLADMAAWLDDKNAEHNRIITHADFVRDNPAGLDESEDDSGLIEAAVELDWICL